MFEATDSARRFLLVVKLLPTSWRTEELGSLQLIFVDVGGDTAADRYGVRRLLPLATVMMHVLGWPQVDAEVTVYFGDYKNMRGVCDENPLLSGWKRTFNDHGNYEAGRIAQAFVPGLHYERKDPRYAEKHAFNAVFIDVSQWAKFVTRIKPNTIDDEVPLYYPACQLAVLILHEATHAVLKRKGHSASGLMAAEGPFGEMHTGFLLDGSEGFLQATKRAISEAFHHW